MSKRVVSLVFSNYKNDNRVYKMAQSLSAEGYEVSVVGMKYDNVEQHQKEGKVSVHRVQLMTENLPRGTRFLGIFRYIEFAIKTALKYGKADIWHCNDFPPFLLGSFIRLFNRKLKLVYDCHELQSETLGKSRVEKKFITFFESRLIKNTTLIVVSKGIRQIYSERYKLPLEGINIIYNVPHYNPEEKEPEELFRNQFGIPKNEKIFIYQGGMGDGRGIKPLLETFKGLENIHVVFMGYGKHVDEVLLASENFNNIHYQEAVPYDQVMRYTSSADFGMVSTEDLCLNHYYCMPNKLFEYTQAGVPVLVNALKDCSEFVEENGIGMSVKEETIESWKNTVRAMSNTDRSEYKDNIRVTKKKYNWEIEEKKLIGFYKDLN